MQYPVSCRLTLKGEEDTMEFATKCIHEIGAADATSACLGALDAWLVIRGIKTLPLRMEQHQKMLLPLRNGCRSNCVYNMFYIPVLKIIPVM